MDGIVYIGIILGFFLMVLITNKVFWTVIVMPILNFAAIIAVIYGVGTLFGAFEDDNTDRPNAERHSYECQFEENSHVFTCE